VTPVLFLQYRTVQCLYRNTLYKTATWIDVYTGAGCVVVAVVVRLPTEVPRVDIITLFFLGCFFLSPKILSLDSRFVLAHV